MSVRRLAPQSVQPASFAFTAENLAWVDGQIAKYPAGRQASAVIPLLWKAQEQCGGWLPRAAIEWVAQRLDMAVIRVMEVATFYTMFNLEPVGQYFIQFCGTTPCKLRGADAIKDVLKKRIGEERHVTADGKFSWLEVECLGACCNAPMVQINFDYYEDLTPDSMLKVIDDLAAGRPVKPGPQSERRASEPAGAVTTLTDPALFDGSVVGSWRKRFDEEAAKAAAAAAAPAPAPAAPAPAPAPAPAAAAPVPKAADETVSDDHKPVLLSQAREGKADDLKLIWGVGPKLETMLHGMGVFHFDQIAGWTEMNLKWVDQNLGSFKGRAVRDDWIGQSKKLATGWRPESSVGEKPQS